MAQITKTYPSTDYGSLEIKSGRFNKIEFYAASVLQDSTVTDVEVYMDCGHENITCYLDQEAIEETIAFLQTQLAKFPKK